MDKQGIATRKLMIRQLVISNGIVTASKLAAQCKNNLEVRRNSQMLKRGRIETL